MRPDPRGGPGYFHRRLSRRPPSPAPAQAQDATPKAFHGVYSGTGIARSKDSFYFGITMRDLDVEIRPADGGGFSVKWTTVLRQGGTPENPDVRKKGTTLTFSPAEGGKLYVDAAE